MGLENLEEKFWFDVLGNSKFLKVWGLMNCGIRVFEEDG